MADRTESELDAVEQVVYHDVDENELSMLLRVHQNNGRALPIGSFTERKISQVVQGATGVTPVALTLLGPNEVLLEFEKETSVVGVGIAMHAMSDWDDFKVRTHCIMAKCDSLINMCHEQELAEREKQMLQEEKQKYQNQLGQVVEKIGSQIEQLDRKIEVEGPPIPTGIVTPLLGSPRPEIQQLVMAPGLPHFSGTEPTPRDEGTYDQWKFQVRGMRAACPDSMVRGALITSLQGEASELLGFVGFNAPMSVILEAMDKRFGKKATTDRLQQEFFQLQQERGERIQHFASRLERAFKKLQDAFPGRYQEEHLKERLFHGVNQQTRDSMRFLYSKTSTTYDTLLSAIKEAEIEWLESRGQARMKSANIIDRSDEIEELRKRLDRITATMKSSNFKVSKLKKERKESPLGSGSNSPRNKKEDIRKNLRGPITSAAGPFKPDQSTFQCHKCGGWGHGWRECATKGNVDWARIRGESEPKENKTVPEKDPQ